MENNKITVLLVDDEPQFRLLLSEVFSREGWHILTATQGAEALAVLSKEKVDIVVSDIYMPIMNGLRLRDTMRQDPKLKEIPVLFISGYSDEMTMAAVHSPKIEGFLQKTKPPQDIIRWVRYLATPIEKRVGLSPGDFGMMR